MKNLFKASLLGVAAFFCMSGQMARKEVQEVPSTQVTFNEPELKQEKPKEKEHKSAARRSMEGETTMVKKSAAKRAVELEFEE